MRLLKMKPFLRALVLLAALLPCLRATAQQGSGLEFKGFIDSYHAAQLQQPQRWMSSRTRLRAILEMHRGEASFYASANFIHNFLLERKTSVSLRELYVDYTQQHWGLRVGRQIVIRGVADGLRVMDVISPMDLSEFLAQDYDDIRLPVNAMRLFFFSPKAKLELIALPSFDPFILPDQPDNPWYIFSGMGVEAVRYSKPSNTLKNSAVGALLSFTLPGVDLSFMAHRGWNKMPAFRIQPNPLSKSLALEGLYHRLTTLGASVSVPVQQLVLRAEAASYLGKSYTAKHPMQEPVQKNALSSLLGLDWYGADNWFISAQLHLEHILDYAPEQLADRQTVLLSTLHLSKKLMDETLELSNFAYIDWKDTGVFNRFSLGYAFTDQLKLYGGFDYFHGENGLFAPFRKNSELWMKARYSF